MFLIVIFGFFFSFLDLSQFFSIFRGRGFSRSRVFAVAGFRGRSRSRGRGFSQSQSRVFAVSGFRGRGFSQSRSQSQSRVFAVAVADAVAVAEFRRIEIYHHNYGIIM